MPPRRGSPPTAPGPCPAPRHPGLPFTGGFRRMTGVLPGAAAQAVLGGKRPWGEGDTEAWRLRRVWQQRCRAPGDPGLVPWQDPGQGVSFPLCPPSSSRDHPHLRLRTSPARSRQARPQGTPQSRHKGLPPAVLGLGDTPGLSGPSSRGWESKQPPPPLTGSWGGHRPDGQQPLPTRVSPATCHSPHHQPYQVRPPACQPAWPWPGLPPSSF